MSTKSLRSAEWASRQELLSIVLYAERPNRDKANFSDQPQIGILLKGLSRANPDV